MRFSYASATLAICLLAQPATTAAQPKFVNGLVFSGSMLDATGEPGANAGRFGFFSDLYFDPSRDEWWAISDRGPGGGTLPYETRVNRFTVDVNPVTGRISRFRVRETILLRDPKGLLYPHSGPQALNGLNPLGLQGDAGLLGASFDPEGLVIDPRSGHLIVADEYGPSLYEFNRAGKLLRVFETPDNLVPRAGGVVNFVADRDGGATAGRQDNRGYEGLAITPDGKRLYAVLQDPLMNEPGPNNGRNGQNLRIVVFDNARHSPTYGRSIAQYVYQLEEQAQVAARILAAGGTATATDPRQGRNIGLSAITAINDHEFLVLERDNRGIGVDDPAGANIVGSKRIYKIDVSGATDVSALNPLPETLAGIVPVTKSELVLDIAEKTLLPNGKQVEKWEGLAIGPRLQHGARLLLIGNDNDYSVTQNGSNVQFDVYVDFNGGSVQRDLDQPTRLDGLEVAPVPAGFVRLPGVLHAYRASAADLRGYVEPRDFRRHRKDDREHGRDKDDLDYWDSDEDR